MRTKMRAAHILTKCTVVALVVAAFLVVSTMAGCGGHGGPILSSAIGGGGSDGGATDGTVPGTGFNDPSKAPSANLLFDGTSWKSKKGRAASFGGEGNIQQSKAAGDNCNSCHGGVCDEYRTGDNDTSNAHGQNFRTAHGRDKIDGYGGGCRPCHTVGYDEGGYNADGGQNASLEGIQCEGCHGPGSLHASASPGNRADTINGVPDAKESCWVCHVTSRRQLDNLVMSITDDDLAGKSATLTVHHPQALLLNGVYGYEYSGGNYTPTGMGHKDIANTCVTCHMQFNSTSGSTTKLDHGQGSMHVDMAACASCHTNASHLQEEAEAYIKQLLITLVGDEDQDGEPDSIPRGKLGGGENGEGGLLGQYAKTYDVGNASADDAHVKKYKAARHNFSFVEHDGSHGAHNYDYAKQLLEDSIASLQGA